MAGPAPSRPEDNVRARKPGLDEIQHRRFEPRRKDLPGRGRAGHGENSRTDDRADPDAGEIERAERALHLPLGAAASRIR